MGYYIYYVSIAVLDLILIPFFMLFSKNQKHKIRFLKLSFPVVLPQGEALIIYWILLTNCFINSMTSN